MATKAKERFDAAVKVIHSLPKDGPFQPSYEMMLNFYGYYKQATEGPCTKTKPWAWDVVAKKKWDAWTKLGEMQRETAMENYVEELKKTIKSCSAQFEEMSKNGDSRIVEAMPQNQTVRDFMGKLGDFYEVIDENLPGKEEFEKRKQEALGSNGSSPDNSSSEVSESGQLTDEYTDHSMMVENILKVDGNQTVLDDLTRREEMTIKLKDQMDRLESAMTNSEEDELTIPKTQYNGHVKGERLDSESDDEFCDTSDHPSQDGSEENTPHKLNSALKKSTERLNNHVHFNSSLMVQTDAEVHREVLAPLSSTLNDNGTPNHNGNSRITDSLLVHGRSPDSSEFSLDGDSLSSNLHSSPLTIQTDDIPSASSGGLPAQRGSGSSRVLFRTSQLSGAGAQGGGTQASGYGNGQEHRPPQPPSGGTVNEQIAMTLLRLQQDMSDVSARLQNVETAIRQNHRQTTPWWPFPNLRGRTLFFVLVWPVIVHWLLIKIFRRRRTQR